MHPPRKGSTSTDSQLIRLAAALSLTAACAVAIAQQPILSWHFDEGSGNLAREQIHHADGLISGVHLYSAGVQGTALRLDGETSGVLVKAAALPATGPDLSIEAWIAMDAYPWNWAPIADQRDHESLGYFFGVDSSGHLGLQAEMGGHWQMLASTQTLPLKRWTHVAATIGSGSMALYVNGQPVAESQPPGGLQPAPDADLLIGRIRYAMLPEHWIHPKFPVWFSFDGLLDQVDMYGEALSPQQVQAAFRRMKAPAGDALPTPQLPSGPAGAGPFGALYTTLKYDPLWDAPRRAGPDSDVVVRFDDAPVRLVSWQGTNYIPAWVTENGKWYTDEFVESWGAANCPGGEDCEPMSDKQNRYAHVRIVENTPARAVIHVRYGQCEVEQDTCANPDPLTGWTDVADDTYTIYPDEVAARKTVAWSSKFQGTPEFMPEFQETIIINPAGTRPEDNIETDALTFVNMQGATHTYSWLHPPTAISEPPGANIQAVNLKAEWKPFQIVLPDKPLISVYQGERTWSMFEWWNHWPVAQVKSSGISAVAADRPSHSSLSHIEGQPWKRTPDSVTKIMLDGLSNRPPAELAVLARSWADPPDAQVVAGPFHSKGYDPAQRAFLLERSDAGSSELHLVFHASPGSPLKNPALVATEWGDAAPELQVNGKPVAWGKDARFGLIPTLGRSTLVVWLRMEAAAETSIELAPAGAEGR